MNFEKIKENDIKVKANTEAKFAEVYEAIKDRVSLPEKITFNGTVISIANRFARVYLTYNIKIYYAKPLKPNAGRIVLEPLAKGERPVRLGVDLKNVDRIVSYIERAIELAFVNERKATNREVAKATLTNFLADNELNDTKIYTSTTRNGDFVGYETKFTKDDGEVVTLKTTAATPDVVFVSRTINTMLPADAKFSL